MPFEDMSPPAAKHYRRDYIPGSSVPGIGYPTSQDYVYGFPPQMPDAYPDYGPVATPPPELLERLGLPQGGLRFQDGLPVFPQGGQSLGPGAAVPRRNSTTIMVLPGKNSKQLRDMVEKMGDGFGALSPIFKALMGKDKD
jgi:hypothetical protein